jgi:hypothetical protein
MNNRLRQIWFRNYLLIILLTWAVLVVLAFLVPLARVKDALGTSAALTGAALSVIYFVQKQKLEEIQLFERLFTQFNRRYEEMNVDLQKIRADKEVPEGCRKTLNAYFNLCAEEYLFYSEGRIHALAWRGWCRGMMYYLTEDGPILRHWKEEAKADSHYGLTLEIIRAGAA